MADTFDANGNGIEVSVSVDGIDLDDQQERVINAYVNNMHTFIRKNQNYGGSFEHSAKMESIMRHGEVRQDELFDIIAEQILVRGFYDKLSRFHQLQIQGDSDMVGEDIEDTLLDLGNYAIMLAAMHRKYEELMTSESAAGDDDTLLFTVGNEERLITDDDVRELGEKLGSDDLFDDE